MFHEYFFLSATIEGMTCIENAMEHVARELKMDPLEFRKLNLIPDGGIRMANTIPVRLRELLQRNKLLSNNAGFRPFTVTRNLIGDMITQIETEADVAQRKIDIDLINSVRDSIFIICLYIYISLYIICNFLLL